MTKKLFALLIIIVLTLTACGNNMSEECEPMAIAIIYGAHANQARFNINAILFDPIIEACRTYGEGIIISNEGKPVIIETFDISAPKKKYSKSTSERLASGQTSQIIEFIEEIRPQTEEANLYDSLKLAARALNASSCDIRKILLVDSGISTAGLIDFQQAPLGSFDTEALIENLRSNCELIDLRNIEIEWCGCCDVLEPQTTLSGKEAEHLKSFWQHLINECGGTVYFRSDLPSNFSPDTTLPPVTPIETEKVAIDFNQPVRLDASVLFRPDSDELINEDAAQHILFPYAEAIQNCNMRVAVIGSTATAGTYEDCYSLSVKRAHKIAQMLIDMGIGKNQLEEFGIGCSDSPLRVNDLFPNGALDEEKAKKNRAVFLLDMASQAFIKLELQ